MPPAVSAYGAWRSPLGAADIARSAISLSDIRVSDSAAYWVESRPADGGRHVIVRASPEGAPIELTAGGFDVRTRVHEYGGAPYLADHGSLYFSNFADQRVYAQHGSDAPAALTPEGYRYADFDLHPSARRLFCVREDHTRNDREPRNTIVALDAEHGGAGTVLFSDSDFVAYPRVSPEGARIAFIAWNHPDMPWDATTLYVAELSDGRLTQIRAIAGGAHESVVEPIWDRDGSLYLMSDRSDYWNLYRLRGDRIEPVCQAEAEFAEPLWGLGQSNYALTGSGRAVVRYGRAATDSLGILDLKSGVLTRLDVPFVSVTDVRLLSPDTAIAIAASEVEGAAVVAIDLATARRRVLRAPDGLKLPDELISRAQPIEFPTATGLSAHAFFYPPTNPNYRAPSTERPPLVVQVHGGPTGHSKPQFSPSTQYWTTRGFAMLDVNHGGSSGFGRAYRERLNGNWGVVDVNDTVSAVAELVRRGQVDSARTAIRGGSAGGFTVLSALAFHHTFKAGANYYGVSDPEALAHDTHKFESRYLDRLLAPLPGGRAIYEARAPIRHPEGFEAPLITFQGTEDQVVPPNQSRAIVEALRAQGIRVVYIEFPGEQHGFRKAESIVRALEAELEFYGEVFGFEPAHTAPEPARAPLELSCEQRCSASPSQLYRAWTERFDLWFAQPGTVWMRAQVGTPYFFETVHVEERHPHYGRFLRLEKDRLIQMTWVTAAGTHGVETVVTVELVPQGSGTLLHLSHSGFPDKEALQRHTDAWPRVLTHLDELLRGA
jgi:dipeptidyl aminopeptidase/acylaminoacyl peptidase/uncharacterized protein YndB with AHSA1/START domain